MPLLTGKSSHGSKPMTSLSFTFSWMPHCCPQKQQCVLTSRSGSTEESTRWPVGYPFNGPNLASNSGVRGGSAAIGSSWVVGLLGCWVVGLLGCWVDMDSLLHTAPLQSDRPHPTTQPPNHLTT